MKTHNEHVNYRIYQSLLDAYDAYVRSSDVWESYRGFSENPPHTPEEFEAQQLRELLDKINRVPVAISEAALRGTALNALIDLLVCGETDPRCEFRPVYEEQEIYSDGDARMRTVKTDKLLGYNVHISDRGSEADFYFSADMCERVTSLYPALETLPQQYLSRTLYTPKYGSVELYGFADYVLPDSVHDLKTCSRYFVGKFKHNSQHLAYPYCIDPQLTQRFDYDVVEIGRGGAWQVYQETYMYDPVRDIPALVGKVEGFIGFLNRHSDEITDRKIFNQPFNRVL